MDRDNQENAADELPFHVDEEKWGEIGCTELVSPGVYLLGTRRNDYYVVLTDGTAKAISSHALSYGIDSGDAVFFPLQDGRGGYDIIRYELARYFAMQGHPAAGQDPLWTIARYASEDAPDYFGSPPPPSDTPQGHMTRYLRFDEGIFFIETDQCEQMLAVSYPIWTSEFPDMVAALGELTERDRKIMGYLFFPKRISAVPLYEICCRTGAHPAVGQFIASEDALVASIWRRCPEYIIALNAQEQMGAGVHNMLYRLMRSLGVDDPGLVSHVKELIPYIPDTAESEFLDLPDSWSAH